MQPRYLAAAFFVVTAVRKSSRPMPFHALAFSRVAPFKPRIGEQGKFLKINEFTLLLLATGAATRPCDWRAAEVLLEDFGRQFALADCSDPERCLRQCLHRAADAVNDLGGICEGAQATLCVVLLNEAGQFWYLNTGNCPAFRYDGRQLLKMHPADSPHPYEVTTGQLSDGEGLLLVSRGVCRNWNEAVRKATEALFRDLHPEAEMADLLQDWGQKWQEDLTLVMAKKLSK